MSIQASSSSRAQQVLALTQAMVQRYYGENDVEFLISLMDPHMIWLGTGEHEFAVGAATVSEIFRSFAGQVPKCNVYHEEHHVVELSPDVYLCSGRMWIETDASTQIFLRVHQRITTVFRWTSSGPRCCHIHISNPYGEMVEGDTGFPTHMAQQSYEYLQEQLSAYKEKIHEQTEILRRISYEDALTGLYNRHMFNQIVHAAPNDPITRLGVACIDLNGLKQINDENGHGAGDELLRQAAWHLQNVFPHEVYRTGGDEFVVIDYTLPQQDFYGAVYSAQQTMEQHAISCSVGASWREGDCNMKDQLEEADRLMYEEKQRYYNSPAHDRRNHRR